MINKSANGCVSEWFLIIFDILHKRTDILNRIIVKGGLMGYVSQMCITDEEKAEQFIHECYSQCHNEEAYRFWGEDLVKDIASYCNTVVQVRA